MMSRHEKHLNSYFNTKRLHFRPSGASNTRLPDEIFLKIFRYLSPSCLLVCAQVCQRWSVLTRESSLWQALLLFLPKEVRDSLMFEETRQENFDWKHEIIRRCTNTRNKKTLALCRKVSVYTGLPANTVGALKFAGVAWNLCVTDTSGRDYWLSADDVSHFSAASSIRWYLLQLPPLTRLTVIQVFAFVPIFFHRNWKPHVRSSSTRSLIIKLDLRSQGSKLLRRTAVSESDMITGHITSPSMLVACWSASWKDDGELAFVTVSLHHHNLIRKILKGSHDRTFVPPPHLPVLDDVDPDYGLHGYSATVELRNHKTTFWGRQYRELYQQHVTDDEVCFGGYSQAEHGSFQKKLSLPWKTELFKNILPDMCFLDATVLDDQKKPMWYVSSPVKIFPNKVPDVNYSAEGERLSMEYKDERGNIRLDFLWIEDEGLTVVTNVEFRVLKSFVNTYFGTSY